jgi:hypothetical protein
MLLLLVGKAVFIGDTNVGKTTIIRRYARRPPEPDRPTVAGDAMQIVVGVRQVQLTVWDTPGHTVYESLSRSTSGRRRRRGLRPDESRVVRERPRARLPGAKIMLADMEDEYPDAAIVFRGVTSALTGDGVEVLFQAIADVIERDAMLEVEAQPPTVVLQTPAAAAGNERSAGCPCWTRR